MSAFPAQQYFVCVREWREHVAIVEAQSPEQARALGLQMWTNDPPDEEFTVEDGGIISVAVSE